jgi:hypothetical protein
MVDEARIPPGLAGKRINRVPTGKRNQNPEEAVKIQCDRDKTITAKPRTKRAGK